MRRHRLLTAALASALALLVVPAAAAEHQPPATPRLTGIDGLLYDSAPYAVPGDDGNLFFGYEFDIACGLGDGLRGPVARLAELARLIEHSGRRVVWTVAPNKSAVLGTEIDPALLPQGSCDTVGVELQNQVLDEVSDPTYLPVRRLLVKASSEQQIYWRTDPHWTTSGAVYFVQALARELDPRLARRQRYHYGTETRVGGLELDGTPETVQTATPATKVTVRSRTDPNWSYPTLVTDHSWVTGPRSRTYPGRTLLLGDSFMWYALENLRPLFRHGRFLWYAHSSEPVMLKALRRSDTVVIDAYQAFLPGSSIISSEFLAKVRRVLR